jgi:hypothetical protein
MRLCANDFGNVATMDIPTKILDLGAEQPTAAELFWYPNLFWYTPAGKLGRRGHYRLDRAADVVWAAPGAALIEGT